MAITVKGAATGITKILKRQTQRQERALYRTLNVISKRALKVSSREIIKKYPINQRDIRKAVKAIINATRRNPSVRWVVRDIRKKLKSPKQLKKGVSFQGENRRRKKILKNIQGGSRPFVIQGQNSGRDLAVYRPAGHKRKVIALQYSSVPHMFRTVNIAEKLLEQMIKKDFSGLYRKQLKKAKYGA